MIRISHLLPYRYLTAGILASAMVCPTYAQTEIRTIEVSGEHQQMVAAEQYEVSVDLVVRAQQRDDLKDKMDTKRKAMNQLARRFGLKSQDVGYTQAELREEFKWQDNERKRTGFSLRESWWLKLDSAQQNHEVLASLAEMKTVDAYRSQPRANGKQLYRNALAFALNDAKHKARIMAQELGTCLGKPQSIREEQGFHRAPSPMMKSTMEMADTSALPEARVNSQARVHVIWQLKDC